MRNAGSIAGNLMMAHAHPDFSSDLATIFLAAGAVLKCGSAQTRGQTTRVSLTQFFALEPKGLVIEEVFLPALGPEQKLVTHKVSLRRQHAHALVNMGLRAAISPEGAPCVGICVALKTYLYDRLLCSVCTCDSLRLLVMLYSCSKRDKPVQSTWARRACAWGWMQAMISVKGEPCLD